MTTSLLPPGFEPLEPFAATWAIDGAPERAARRSASTEAERRAFYAAALPLMAQALDALDRTPLAAHDAAERRLMLLMLSFAHVALAVEMQGPDEAKHTPHRDKMRITRAPADD
ncbi:MAG: hypothetical protein K2Q06_11965 [Parvularculaceae bacterium]|nr:hypothetical protein [Parvularculaceae bacterium]